MLTQFELSSAQRIARVVRQVEQQRPAAKPLRFDRVDTPKAAPTQVRVVKITDSWPKNTPKTVTFANQTATPNTVVATNLLFDIAGPATSGASTTKVCIIGKEGTAWYFVNTEKGGDCSRRVEAKELDEQFAEEDSDISGISEGQGPQVLLNDNGCVKWVRLAQGYVLGSYGPGVSLIEAEEGGITWTQIPVWFFASPGQGELASIACDKLGAQFTGGSVTIGGGLGSGTVTIEGDCGSGKEINIEIDLTTESCPTT